jgi:ABC-type glycerol-3-phosphate transport system substrate-binding protein
MRKWILFAVVAVVVAIGTPSTAQAECLEVGWRDSNSNWVYYNARVADFNQAAGTVRIKYDFKNGELDLKIREKEAADGSDYIVFRGRWYERGGRSGKVRLEMAKGRHRAKGWYTHGDSDSAARYDFVLRECKGSR